eukprot:1201355-Pyramimonas_sp.AAC.1
MTSLASKCELTNNPTNEDGSLRLNCAPKRRRRSASTSSGCNSRLSAQPFAAFWLSAMKTTEPVEYPAAKSSARHSPRDTDWRGPVRGPVAAAAT